MKRPSPFLILALSWVAVSFAGPLVKLSGSDPLAIAFWRLLFTVVIVGLIVIATGEWEDWGNLSRKGLLLSIATGVFLACDYWLWNTAVKLTTIASSVTLTSMAPAFVIVLSGFLLKEFPTRRQMFGMSVAIVGAFIIAYASRDASADGDTLKGNLLALAAAMCGACYYVSGRYLRTSLRIWAYVGLVYFSCLVTLSVAAFATQVNLLPESRSEYWIFAGLALGPMLIGTTGKNWALKYLPAYIVSLVALAEPVGATLIGTAMPGVKEVPSLLTIVGGIITIGGVLIAQLRTKNSSIDEP